MLRAFRIRDGRQRRPARVEVFQLSLYSGLPAAQQLFRIDQACSVGLKLGGAGRHVEQLRAAVFDQLADAELCGHSRCRGFPGYSFQGTALALGSLEHASCLVSRNYIRPSEDKRNAKVPRFSSGSSGSLCSKPGVPSLPLH